MRAGLLRHRVSLQHRAIARNSWGDETNTWNTYDTVWASIRPLSGNERAAQAQAQTEISHDIRIRYHKVVKPQHRISYGDRVFEINAVIDVEERKRELQLMCTEAQE